MTIDSTSSRAPLLATALAFLVHCGASPEQPAASRTGSGGKSVRGAGGAAGAHAGGQHARGGAGMSSTAGNSAGLGAGGRAGATSGASGVAGMGFGGLGGVGGFSGFAGAVSAGELTLASTAVPTNGVFLDANTCVGADTSPDLEWKPGLGPTQSYAVMLTDAATGAAQWIVWDIPASVTSLPAALPPGPLLATPSGAKQVSSSGNGYVGPCQSGEPRFYEFTIFALPVATLAGVTTESSPTAVATAINLTPPIEVAFFGASTSALPATE